jgi:hypothetical protein
MKKYLFCISLGLIISYSFASGQSYLTKTSAQLEKLFSRLPVVPEDLVRIRINDSIKVIVEDYVKYDSVFFHRFENVRFLGQVTSPDSAVKIITWNLNLRDEPGKYYLYIIRKQEEGKPNILYSLSSMYNSNIMSSDTVYTAGNWYGALYYAINPQIINGVRCWMLLGIDYGNPEITRKIIETLSFGKDEKIIFGMKSFQENESLKYRAVFEYSSEATMTLRFGGDDSVIFDHLVPFSPELVDQRKFYGPQYTNDAYVLENGKWKLRLNVDVRNKERIKTTSTY